jgi:F420-non-reducing hydrogenase large subunit
MKNKLTIEPVTRLEGHGRIEIFLDEKGDVERAFFQVPEFRGFEKFAEGRPAEEMPVITSKICGVCPTAHHMASGKAVDALFNADPPAPAKKIRELMYSAFMVEDHALHFFFLGGPDFIVGPDAPAAERNILGVIKKVGMEIGRKVTGIRERCRHIISTLGGKAIHPVCNLPGGVSRGVSREEQKEFMETGKSAVEFAKFTLKIFEDIVLKNGEYLRLIAGDIYRHETYSMGMVDEKRKVSLLYGKVRVTDPGGRETALFDPCDYLDHIAEHVEPWSYMKFAYLRNVGWNGFTDGRGSGIYRVGPLARLNASEGMATPAAQSEYERMLQMLGGKPVHNTLAYHWSRLIELQYAAERLLELAGDDEILDPHIRTMPTASPSEGVGLIEAPRGTLIHHYKSDEKGIIRSVNLIVATTNNAAAICMSIERAARKLINKGKVSDGILNMVEMAFRAYDPCLACATHSLPGRMQLIIRICNQMNETVRIIRRD